MKKSALVTGSTRGIGKAIGYKLVEMGYSVFFMGRNAIELNKIKNDLGHKSIPMQIDFEDHNFMEKFSNFFLDFDLPDVVVHNVGMRVSIDNQPLTYSAVMKSLHINLGVAVSINSFFLPLFVEANRCLNKSKRVITHISSNSAINGNGAPGYVAAKAGLNAYVKSTARYYAKDDLIINAVMPGIVEFEGGGWDKKIKDKERYESEIIKQPLGRFATAEEVADFVVSLCLMKNQLTNGEIFTLSGGLQ